ncbi:MAG: hypothetical protein VYC34_07570 [Planctomycetota bacterium]|nr:hypothetical protein [Planctomycetota bacterium]
MNLSHVTIWAFALLFAVGLGAQGLRLADECCGPMSVLLGGADTGDDCCGPVDSADEHGDSDSHPTECPGGCGCLHCGCTATTVVVRSVAGMGMTGDREAGELVLITRVALPRDAATDLLRPPRA